jgi:hypothetical protein
MSKNRNWKSPLGDFLRGMMALLAAGYFEHAAAFDKVPSLVTGEPMGELAVAGRLSIDLDAEFMMSRTYGTNAVLNWYNCGYSGGGRGTTVGGDFGDFGFQVPYTKREEIYPHAVTLDGVHAAQFDGRNNLTGNFEVEKKIAGANPMALEVWFWAEHPGRGDAILGWQSRDGRETSAALEFPSQFVSGPKWQHLVVNCTAGTEDWYLNGVKVLARPRAIFIREGHVMVLGGASVANPSFKGAIAAVRLHDSAMTPVQIAHNFQGGARLGTEMHNWWRIEPDQWFSVESEHFRHAIDKQEMAKWTALQHQEFEGRVPGMLHLAELVYHTYSERLALRIGVVSRRPEKRGDGIKYKIPIQPTSGGSFMGSNDDFGWACQFPGFINPHELVHGCQVMTGALQGNYWETHANFPQTYNGIYQTFPVIASECPSAPASGRTYYHDRLMFEHLAQTPEFGPMFISKLWYDGPTDPEKTPYPRQPSTHPLNRLEMVREQNSPYPWKAFIELVPGGVRTLGREWTRMVQRTVTWDYTTYVDAPPPALGNTIHGNDGVVSPENRYLKVARDLAPDIRRYARIRLQQIPYDPDWWRVPKEQAPQQLGWNICPLKFKPGTVSANLAGYVDPARGSDWRAGFVGVDQAGKPVYGNVFGPGMPQTFQAGEDMKELYLVVCAVPTNIMAINMTGDFRSFEQEPFPYKVKFTGCQPDDALIVDFPDEKGSPHPNGGGFVAATARADASAYIGPNARVIGNSKVLGNARIEDEAVIRNATVKDDAIVSGRALVEEDSVVAGRAEVRDYAIIRSSSIVDGSARVLEHADICSKKRCGDGVVVKGIARVYGGNQSGTAMIDGFYAKGNEITKGKWFTWSWGQGKNPGELDQDFGGLYADYDFSQEHPWMAQDAFGATWGYLINNPAFVACPEFKSHRSTLLTPEATLATLDREPDSAKNYGQLLAAYIRPPVSGDYIFYISADDEGEMWIGPAGSDKPDKKLCHNPFFAPYRDYGRFPTQKSAPVRLEAGRMYPINVLHVNVDNAGSLSIAWQKPGDDKPAQIPADLLYTSRNARRNGVIQRVWGPVSSIAEMTRRPDYPDGTVAVSTTALLLNGLDQFVDLPKDVADMRDCTYSVTFKWYGGGQGQRLFEFGNPNGDFVCMSPCTDQRLVFAIRHGSKTQFVAAPAIQPYVWTNVRLVLKAPMAYLFVNNLGSAETGGMTFMPCDTRASQCYLGRGIAGGFFNGIVSRFSIYSQAVPPSSD